MPPQLVLQWTDLRMSSQCVRFPWKQFEVSPAFPLLLLASPLMMRSLNIPCDTGFDFGNSLHYLVLDSE